MTAAHAALEEEIERFAATPPGSAVPAGAAAAVEAVLDALERGELRAALREPDGQWRAVAWVKRSINTVFSIAETTQHLLECRQVRVRWWQKRLKVADQP